MGKKKGLFTTEVDIKIARILTTAISPVSAALLACVILYREYIVPYHGTSPSWLILVSCIVAATIGTLFFFLRSGKISNWDISDRRQRPKVLLLVLIYDLVLVTGTWILGLSQATAVLILFSFSLGLASLITLVWKVSFHTFSVTLVTMFSLFTFNEYRFYPFLLIPFLIAWTRIVLKKHSPAQAVGGIALAIATTSTWALFPIIKRLLERIVG